MWRKSLVSAWVVSIMIVMNLGTSVSAQSTVVVVTTESLRPVFLEELHSVDHQLVQHVAEREGYVVFQKNEAYYLIHQKLLNQSRLAKVNRFLQHLFDNPNMLNQSFTFDDLPSSISVDLRQLVEECLNYINPTMHFSYSNLKICFRVNIKINAQLRNGTKFSEVVGYIQNAKMKWRSYEPPIISRVANGDSSRSDASAEYRGRRITPDGERSFSFHFNKFLEPSTAMRLILIAAALVDSQRADMNKKMQQMLLSIQNRAMRDLGVPSGSITSNQLTQEMRSYLEGYLSYKYRATISDLSALEIRPEAYLCVSSSSDVESGSLPDIVFPIEYLLRDWSK